MASGCEAGTAAAQEDRNRASRQSFIVLAALGYAIVSTAWILLSDRLLAGFPDVTAVNWMMTVKGLVYVAITTVLLVLALYFVPATPRNAGVVPGPPWPLAMAFAIVAIGIAFGTLMTYQVAVATLRSNALLAVTSVAAQKADQVTNWLANSRDQALAAAHDPALAERLANWMAHPDAAASDALTVVLRRMQAATSARGVYLVTPDGSLLLGIGPPLPESPQLQQAANRAAFTGQAALIDLHRLSRPGPPVGDLNFGYVVPTAPAGSRGLVLAAFDFEPGRAFFRTLDGWPVPSLTGTSLLVRDDDAGTVVLTSSPEARPEGFGRPLAVGDDTLAASAPVPGSPWRVVAKLDSAEALGGVPRMLVLTGAGRMAILCAVEIALILLWQRLRLRLALAEVANGRQLLMAEARFRATFDQAAVGIAHTALDGRFLRVNQRICDTIGYSREQLLDLSAHDLAVPEQRAEVLLRLRSLATGEIDSYTEDRRYVDASGRFVDLSVTVSMVHDRAEAPYLLIVAQDIGDRKRAETALRQLTADLESRVRQEVAAREAAQERAAHAERIQALGQLAGGIAHDFNNVLQAVIGAATLIERRPDEVAGVRRLARLAIEAVERGASTTRRLLAFGHRGNLSAEPVEVAALLDDLQEILSHTLGVSIDVQVDLAAGVPPLFADKGQLETAVVNLATNARDAMPAGGRLTLSAETEIVDVAHPAGLEPGRYVRLTVADTGSGMDAATLARAAEPFFTTKGLGAGTGLGLPMAMGFAEQSGGALSIESAQGKGTTITLWLPAADSEPSSITTAPRWAEDTAASVSGASTARARVLLVDDEAMVREVIAEHLEDAGYDVLTAANGTDALDLLGSGETADILVTDLSMPGMDGFALIRAVRERRPGLPAVLLTGYAGDGAALATGGDGAFTLLRKPVSGLQLLDRVRALLAERTPRDRPTGHGVPHLVSNRGDGGLADRAGGSPECGASAEPVFQRQCNRRAGVETETPSLAFPAAGAIEHNWYGCRKRH